MLSLFLLLSGKIMKIRLFFFLFTLLPSLGFAHFSDIQDHRYATAIDALAKHQIVQGYPGNLFKPDQSITRAELLKIILFAANIERFPIEESCFRDIHSNERYAEVVCTAKAMGIVQGYPDGTFKPNQKVSLVEGLKMAIVGFGIEAKETNPDLRYEKYLDFSHQHAIFSKYEFFPEQDLSRGMMAHLAIKLLQGQTESWNGNHEARSSGCEQTQLSSPLSAVMVNGVERHFIMDISNYHHSSPTPARLIFAFHGRTSPNNGLSYYGLNEGSAENTIIIYPAGLPEEWPHRNWRDPWDKVSNLRDYQLFDAILEEVSNNYCINFDEIYGVGHSLGGWFTSMLNCARGDKIRGVGIVGGSSMLFPKCSGPSAAIIFHNPTDPLASFAGGEQIRDAILKQNQCWLETEDYPNAYGMNCSRYMNCIPGARVVFCSYSEWGHMWPWGATAMMMKFWSEEE